MWEVRYRGMGGGVVGERGMGGEGGGRRNRECEGGVRKSWKGREIVVVIGRE